MDQQQKDVMYMLGKIDAGIVDIHRRLGAMDNSLNSHSGAIRSLEQTRSETKGKVKVLSMLWGSVSGIGVLFIEYMLKR